ncbi:hypothetical protein AB4G91_02705 [Macrococcoides goetzii]|uniref:hypothetical protein n=1 Tax=Macrococcus sp. PK TaxID=2801919 RepID=UPI001F0EBD1A|nr:hypothetical protein [Macrococcus sp. PK]MCH4984210.1 hypothetical protein [Macrococcus sp. PK]
MNNTTSSQNKSTITKTSFSSNDINNLLKKRDITQSLSPKKDILDKLNSRPTLPSSHPAKIRNDLLSRTKTASTINSSIQSRFNKRANELLTLRSDAIHRLNKLNNLKSSYQSKLIGLNNHKAFSNFNKVMKPISLGLKYYEENKEEIDKTLELFEKYAKDYPVEAEEMSVVEFIDFVEFQENFALVFKEVFSPVASYQVPTSYQMISDVYEKLDNQIEKYMSVEEKETIHKMFSIVVSFIFGKAVEDIPNFSEISTLVQLIIVVMFYPQIKKFLRH